ncbi:MAG: hypothetical protein WAZ19_02415 [Anaerolineae bacterium]
MDINKLPNGLQELARKRKEEDSDVEWFGCGVKLAHAFNWGKTKEGWQFWEDVYHGRFDIYTEMYSNHEWIEDYPGEYQVIDGTLVVVRDYVGRESFEYGAAYSIGAKLHEDVDISSLTITPAVLANGYYAGEDQIPEVYEAWAKGYKYALETFGIDNTITNLIPDNTFKGMSNNPPDVVYVDTSTTLTEDANLTGGSGDNYIPKVIKHYSHIGDETKEIYKYPKGNMLKPIDIDSLLWPIFRHWKKMMFPLKDDVETFEDHLAAILCNSSMILDQLKLKK